MIVYRATNLINGKIYIGQTIKTLTRRKSKHLYDTNHGSPLYFHKALRKYGFNNFKWQVICICPNINILNEQEEYYIAFYNSMNNGYNMTSGGKNYIPSEETKQKISENNRLHVEGYRNYEKYLNELRWGKNTFRGFKKDFQCNNINLSGGYL